MEFHRFSSSRNVIVSIVSDSLDLKQEIQTFHQNKIKFCLMKFVFKGCWVGAQQMATDWAEQLSLIS